MGGHRYGTSWSELPARLAVVVLALLQAVSALPVEAETSPVPASAPSLAPECVSSPLVVNARPVGLDDPRTGRRPHAVVQLRQDTLAGDHLNLVGFQSRLKWGEQERVFRLIPGLEQARFVRLGQVHRNTYVDAPRLLLETYQTRKDPGLFLAPFGLGVRGRQPIVGQVYRVLAFHGVAPPPRLVQVGAVGDGQQPAARVP